MKSSRAKSCAACSGPQTLRRFRGRVEQRRSEAARGAGRLGREPAVRRNAAAPRLPIRRLGLRAGATVANRPTAPAPSLSRCRRCRCPSRRTARGQTRVAAGHCCLRAQVACVCRVPVTAAPGPDRDSHDAAASDARRAGVGRRADPWLCRAPVREPHWRPGPGLFRRYVTDAVTVHLGTVAGLDVISRTSARQYKNTAKRPPGDCGGVDTSTASSQGR